MLLCGRGAYQPAGQLVHPVELATEYEPMPHCRHADCAELAVYVPAAHEPHAVEPSEASEYDDAEHAEHKVEPLTAEK